MSDLADRLRTVVDEANNTNKKSTKEFSKEEIKHTTQEQNDAVDDTVAFGFDDELVSDNDELETIASSLYEDDDTDINDEDDTNEVDIESEDTGKYDEPEEIDDDEPVQIDNTETYSKAELFSSVTLHPEDDIKQTQEIDEDPLFANLKDLEADSARMANEIQQEQERIIREKKSDLEVIPADDINDISTGDDIDSIISAMDNPDPVEESNDMDIEEMLKEYEENKKYAKVTPNEEITGPADYIVEKDEDYSDNIEDILISNNISIVKKSNNAKQAILERFTNSGDKVTGILPNSGIYVTMSGAGTSEIIAMNTDSADNEIRSILSRLDVVSKHIVGSSIGKMTLTQLINVVSYYDMDTLFYMLFAATHPNEFEMSLKCSYCGKDYFINERTTDLLMNSKDFKKRNEDIKNNVTTYNRLMETSELGKIYKQVVDNMIIYYRHPSINHFVRVTNNLSADSITKYEDTIDLAYGINKILLHVDANNFIEIDDPNEILNLISKIKNPESRYRIFDMYEQLRPESVPQYGFKATKCPHCNGMNQERSFSMEDILFTAAQQESWIASLRWAVKTQKRRKESKKD